MKFRKWEIALLIALAVSVTLSAAFTSEQRVLSSKLIRLHVVGNSNLPDDQAAKLKVRDAVYEYVEAMLKPAGSRKDAENVIRQNITLISAEADKAAKAAGQSGAVAQIAVESFPTREYDTFSLPAGEYTSLRVKIGEGEGKNWWCVVFPPLCMSAAQGESPVDAFSLSDGEKVMITSGYTVKFRILELINSLRDLF